MQLRENVALIRRFPKP